MTEKQYFDLIVIGAGTGGYAAAFRAAQAGKKVALVERGDVGGTCLNVGCIPTKTLIANAQVLQKVKHAADFGISTGTIAFDYSQMKTRKDSVLSKIRKGLEGLFVSNHVTLFRGMAQFTGLKELKVQGKDNVLLHADKMVIATGSEPLDIPAFPCDHQKIFNSTSILEMTTLPKSLVVIGGGYIGCEFASLYAELGVKVTVLEALPSIVSAQGKTISDVLTAAFKKQGIDVRTNVMVEGIDKSGSGVTVRLKDQGSIPADAALVAIGRKVVTEGLALDKTGVLLSDRGAVLVNEKMETNVPGIYAVGDVTGKVMLAHVASHQGIVAAENAICGDMVMHYDAVPAVIFTLPEIAMVGLTQEQAMEKGYTVATGKFPFQALGKATASMETEGFAQVVIDKKTGQILGAQVVGHEASTLIAEMALAVANELTIDCVVDTIHAHPTLPESWHEAALLSVDKPMHMPPRAKR